MARIRTIKPEFPHSETIGRLSRDARLLFVELWTIADDEGRARAASRMLASLLFPYDDDAPDLLPIWLDELEDNGCIRRYDADGSAYLEIINWLKHQKIDHASKSKLPAFSEGLARPRENSRSLAPDHGREGNRPIDSSLRSLSPQPAGDGNAEPTADPGEPLRATREVANDRELILDLVDIWNVEAASLGLPRVQDITPKRIAALRARIRDFKSRGLDDPREGFRELMAKIRGSPFLIAGTKTAFRADFDFATTSSKFNKILEGSYEAPPAQQSGYHR